MMIATVGARLLGLQVAQIESVLRWARRKQENVTLAGLGRNMSVASVCVAALDVKKVITRLVTQDLPASLKLLIEQDQGYDNKAGLYCFGLLEQFDIRELLAMAEGREVECRQMWGDAKRVALELGPLKTIFADRGANSRLTLA